MLDTGNAKTIAQIASSITIFIGFVVLIGWTFDISLLKSVFPQLVSMKANTAIAFLLAGISLWSLTKLVDEAEIRQSKIEKSSRHHPMSYRLVAQGCAMTVTVIGLLTLSQYLLGWNFRIDEFWFRDSPKAIETFHPGRMGVNTAVNFLLVGSALWLLAQKKQRSYWLAHSLSLVAIWISSLALIGYIYGVKIFYQFGVYTTSMALHTAFSFDVLCLGILFAYPNHGFMQTFTKELNGSLIARRLVPGIVALPITLGWLIIQGQKANYYDAAFGMSLLAIILTTSLLALLWHCARFLNRLDSQRQFAEAGLRESEKRYRMVVENVPQLIWISRVDGFVEYFNQKWVNYTGLQLHECLGWDWQQVVHPEDLSTTVKAWMTELKTGNPIQDVHYRLKRYDGVYRWHIVQVEPVGNANGTIVGWFGTYTDIHDQKQAQERLRESEARLRLFIESDLIGIVIGDSRGGLIEVNNAFLQIIGYSRKDFLSNQLLWTNLTPTEYLPLDQAAIQEARDKGVSKPYEKEYIRKDGSRVPVLLGCTIINRQQEELILAYILDISVLKRTQAALKESEQRFRYVTDSAPVMVWMSDTTRLCNYFNKYWLDFTGREMEEELGDGWSKGVHPDDLHYCLDTYTTAFDTRQQFQMEYRLRRFDGEYRWILDIGTPRFTPTGEFVGYIGSGMDIHDRKQAEEQIRQINETLEERVKQRTAQLEAANKELESFSYSVSHDLRAPLRHITGFVDLLQKSLEPKVLDATSQRYLNIINETTKQAGKLIDDLLAFSRMGRTEMRYINIDMNQLLQEVHQNLDAETKNRQVTWHIQPLSSVQGDASMLRLVFRNLLENALKYTRTRPLAEITIGSTETPQDVVFFVRDNGIGFDMRYVHKLFGVFQRLHSDPQFEGTGVGLANVHRIIHRHGGHVWAESEIDQGATFYFSLPKGSGVRSEK